MSALPIARMSGTVITSTVSSAGTAASPTCAQTSTVAVAINAFISSSGSVGSADSRRTRRRAEGGRPGSVVATSARFNASRTMATGGTRRAYAVS